MSEKTEALLGHATTRELIEELTARIEVDGMLDYSTVNGAPELPAPTTPTDA